ncbi:MAG TPA: MOSC domain-containing protein [Lacunisphaera sp.]
MKIAALYISPGHNYFGRHGQAPGEHPLQEVPAVECLAGRGLVGDRFLDYKEDYAGQITFFAGEVYDEIRQALQQPDRPAAVFRRNVLTRGADLNALIGQEFEVQGVRFVGTRECSPCYWMDQAFAPGAEAWLKGRGGLRARILSSGWLKVDVPPC